MLFRNVRMRTLYLLVAVLLSSSLVFGQESRATIIGRVMDPSGAVVPGGNIRAVNLATNAGGSSVTNESGNFEIPYLLPGLYRVTVESAGFKMAVRDQIELRVSDRLALDFALEVGAVGESVTVTGETPLLQTTSASAGMVVSERMIQEAATSGGNAFFLARLSPGVFPSSGYGYAGSTSWAAATNIIVNGTTNVSETTLDGSPNMAERQTAFSPPADMVQEFKIHTVSYDASLGHAAGAVTSVSTKSGTNAVHGSGHYMPNEWRAVSWFTNRFVYDPTTGPINEEKKKRATPGGFRYWISTATMTAPLVIPKLYNGKDRTFWSFGWEDHGVCCGGIKGEARTVPSPAERQGDLSELLAAGSMYQIYDPLTTVPASQKGRFQRQPIPGNIIPKSRLDPIALKILSYYPDPNQQGTIDGRENRFHQPLSSRYLTSLMNRFDHVISDKHRVFMRWSSLQMDNKSNTLPTSATEALVDRTARGLVLDDVYVFNPQLLLNVRYGLTYQDQYNYRGSQGFNLTTLGFPQRLMDEINTKNSPAGLTFPLTQIDGSAYTNLGTNGGTDVKTYYHNFGATVTKITGSHSMKFGGEFRLMQENGFNYGSVSPQLNFAQAYTRGPLDNSPTAPIGQGLASMLLGIPTGGQININASRAEQSGYSSLFIQDDWRLTSRLTLNVGLRYEYESPTTERFNRSIRSFDFQTVSPIASLALANYAKAPIPEVPVSAFRTLGGLTFAGANGQLRGLWSPDKNNFAPRVGLALQLTSKTVIRAGFGIFYDMLGIDRQDVNQGGFNQATSIIASIDNGQTYQETLSNLFPKGLDVPRGAADGLATFLGRGASFFNENPLNPYMQRWSFSVQRQLPARVLFETSYVGNRGTKLAANRQFTATPAKYLSMLPYRDQATIDYLSAQVPNPFYGIPEFAGTGLGSVNISRSNLLKPYPHFSGITANLPTGYSYFHSLQTSVEKRMGAGFTLQAAWTYSKYMDAIAYLNETDPRPEEVVSANDRTHRFVLSGLYELPFGRGRAILPNAKGVVEAIVGGWQFQGLYEGQTGAALGFGNAIFNGNLHDIELPVGERRAERWFNTDAGFERDSRRILGSNIQIFPSRFNGVRGDGINNFNLSGYKNFRIKERFKLQLRYEMHNALNHVQFGAPNTAPGSTAFGKITTEFGNGPRGTYVGLRLTF